MSTIQEPKKKKQKRFRVKIGDNYAWMTEDFHEKGVLVKGVSVIGAKVFNRNVDAGNAIKRTLEVKKEIAESMHADWKAFAAMRYVETPIVEEFETEIE